jgi:hypothetical protein
MLFCKIIRRSYFRKIFFESKNLATVLANTKNDVQIRKWPKKRSPPKATEALVVMNDRNLGVLYRSITVLNLSFAFLSVLLIV